MPGSFHRCSPIFLLQELKTKLLTLLLIIYCFPQLSHCLQPSAPTAKISGWEIHSDPLLILTVCLQTSPAGGAGAGAALAEAELHVAQNLSPERTRQRQSPGRCGAQPAGKRSPAAPRDAALPACLSRAAVHRWGLSFSKARRNAFHPVQIMPEDTWQNHTLSTLPHLLARQS